MGWESEEQFVDKFINPLHIVSKKNRYSLNVLREVRTGYGRPDITVIEYNSKIIYERKKTLTADSLEPLSNKAAYTMSYLSSCRWVSLQRIERFLQCNNTDLIKVVEELKNRRLIVSKEHLIKARPLKEILAIKRVRAYEAKLKQWKEAVNQAERNLWFTNDSYILMPFQSSSVSNLISLECRKRGIGLIFFSEDKGTKIIVKPLKSGFANSPLIWMMNEQLLEGKHE